jgi:hypothetical protein
LKSPKKHLSESEIEIVNSTNTKAREKYKHRFGILGILDFLRY